MKWLIALLAVIAVAHGAWQKGLKVRYGTNPLHIGSRYFMEVPQFLSDAKNARWVETPRPNIGVLPELVLYCPSASDHSMCVFFDDTQYVAGVQVAIAQDAVVSQVLDWEVQGFTKWNPPAGSAGNVRTYWATQMFFVNEEFLQISAEERIASRNREKLLQLNYIWVTGFNGEQMAISVHGDEIADSPVSLYTKQACASLKGRHYYYNMTEVTECSSDKLLPWFPLVHSNELIGIGFVTMGTVDANRLVKDYFERPSRSDLRNIVTNGPRCLYDMAADTGITTMHTYFVHNPWFINCLFERRDEEVIESTQ
ncbi:hypothetical protein ACJJTC_004799 [Scirpophaga incertulas]